MMVFRVPRRLPAVPAIPTELPARKLRRRRSEERLESDHGRIDRLAEDNRYGSIEKRLQQTVAG